MAKTKADATKKAPARASSRSKTVPDRFIHEEERGRKRAASAKSSKKSSKSPVSKKQKTTSKSPKKSRSKSPASKSKSPKKSPSPKKSKSKSPGRKKSASPAKKKSASPKRKSTKKGKKEESDKESKESASEESDSYSESEEEEKPKRKRGSTEKKKSSSKGSVSKLKDDVRDELNGMNVPDLKKRLQANDQLVGGSKGELVERIADCIVNGYLPRCPKCFGGKIKKSGTGYFCPGSYDDDKFVSCSWKGKEGDISRPAWKTEDGKLV